MVLLPELFFEGPALSFSIMDPIAEISVSLSLSLQSMLSFM